MFSFSVPLVAVHCFASFALVFLFALGAAAIPEFFATGQREFALGQAVAEINFERDKSKAFLLNLAAQFVYFAAIEQEFARAERAVIPGTARAVFGNVAVHQPHFAGFHFGISVAQGALPFPKALDFGADKNHAGFETVEQFVIIGGGAILRGNFYRSIFFLEADFADGFTKVMINGEARRGKLRE